MLEINAGILLKYWLIIFLQRLTIMLYLSFTCMLLIVYYKQYNYLSYIYRASYAYLVSIIFLCKSTFQNLPMVITLSLAVRVCMSAFMWNSFFFLCCQTAAIHIQTLAIEERKSRFSHPWPWPEFWWSKVLTSARMFYTAFMQVDIRSLSNGEVPFFYHVTLT